MTEITVMQFSDEDKQIKAVANIRHQAMISLYEMKMLEQRAKQENRSISQMGRILIRQGLGLE
ncbi:hypothetical protein [Avibacterium paragallinarum]|uniref:Uncharacterized protein n=1 Tax=Avibacterium paragallinarum TaxID=728 RepID=A0AAE5TKI9_AVIPA|nr:hypothetical protein [Avibacterium paragallinarum]MEE3608161.1 hypothetical protein [Avibacterium paragallinarum]MEE3622165.1 hypothetical protein [Avibacterium paragallinarum]MEE3669290.1 hypothetical protein [Avibacterium paragallinarum]MEE3681416.1 hypothetical protein [Avibacterium paragallinarum]MEE4386726.1 hypothetical protein [Avibacterium paragallinarum]